MPGLLKLENSEADAGKLNARHEVLVCLFKYFALLVCRFLLCFRTEWILEYI